MRIISGKFKGITLFGPIDKKIPFGPAAWERLWAACISFTHARVKSNFYTS